MIKRSAAVHWLAVLALAGAGIMCAPAPAIAQGNFASFRLLAFGDVNLGRSVGQRLLHGELDFPFARLKERLQDADAVFVNLESVISDQRGLTEHPRSNLIFCAPPAAAYVLRDAGITIAATANNHAFDYGRTGVRETIQFCAGQGIRTVGSSIDSTESFAPVIVERNGIRIAFVAYTQLMNSRGGWRGYVAGFDSVIIRREINALHDSVDVVVASYHGGAEYAERPHREALAHMRFLADAGADVVIGHHPHVPFGIEYYHGSVILPSLGNLVFYQPQRSWTQLALGTEFTWTRTDSVVLRQIRLLPVHSGYQPYIITSGDDITRLQARVQRLSSIPVTIHEADSTFHVLPPILYP